MKEKDGKFPVNRFKLEIECESQHMLYQEYYDKMLDAKALKDKAVTYLSKVIAERSLYYQQNADTEPKMKGLKATIPTIEALVACDEGVVKAKDTLTEHQLCLGCAERDVKTLEQRCSMLKYLVMLFSKGYYTVDGPKHYDESTNDRIRDEQRESLNKKRRNKE
ncbi:MAG: recombination mediator protein UvsY [Patescibacteria group bacterium]